MSLIEPTVMVLAVTPGLAVVVSAPATDMVAPSERVPTPMASARPQVRILPLPSLMLSPLLPGCSSRSTEVVQSRLRRPPGQCNRFLSGRPPGPEPRTSRVGEPPGRGRSLAVPMARQYGRGQPGRAGAGTTKTCSRVREPSGADPFTTPVTTRGTPSARCLLCLAVRG